MPSTEAATGACTGQLRVASAMWRACGGCPGPEQARPAASQAGQVGLGFSITNNSNSSHPLLLITSIISPQRHTTGLLGRCHLSPHFIDKEIEVWRGEVR